MDKGINSNNSKTVLSNFHFNVYKFSKKLNWIIICKEKIELVCTSIKQLLNEKNILSEKMNFKILETISENSKNFNLNKLTNFELIKGIAMINESPSLYIL